MRDQTIKYESPHDIKGNSESIAWSHFKDFIEEANIDFECVFYKSFLTQNEYMNYDPPKLRNKKSFFKEIEEHFSNKKVLKPIIFTERKYWYSYKTSKDDDRIQDDNDNIFIQNLERKVSSVNFGGNFCAVIPVHKNLLTKDGDIDIIGFVGFVDNQVITNSVRDELKNLVERFEDLYRQIKIINLSERIDKFLNQSQTSLVNLANKSSFNKSLPALFAENLSHIIKDEFYLDHIEIWLKGMNPNRAESIFEIADNLSRGIQTSINNNVNSWKHENKYSYDILVELDDCVLGWIRMFRNNHSFSGIEMEMFRKLESQIDNYVRDLWEEHVIRQIDHQVFNKAEIDIRSFAKLLIKQIVKEFDAYYGYIELEGGIECTYSIDENNLIEYKKILQEYSTIHIALKQQLVDQIEPKVDKLHTNSEIHKNRYYIFVPLSISQSEKLGSIYLIGNDVLTKVHLDALKRLETHLDNIIKLYLNFKKRYNV